jgi:hypothetical protein
LPASGSFSGSSIHKNHCLELSALLSESLTIARLIPPTKGIARNHSHIAIASAGRNTGTRNATTSTQLYDHLDESPMLTSQPRLNKLRRTRALPSNSAGLQKEQALKHKVRQLPEQPQHQLPLTHNLMSIINPTAWLARFKPSLQTMLLIHPTSTNGSWILDRTSMSSTTLNFGVGPTLNTVKLMRRCLLAPSQFRSASGVLSLSQSEHQAVYVRSSLLALHS